jgi:protein-L-isoaspartate(D-aspartate) O-methyltransferase
MERSARSAPCWTLGMMTSEAFGEGEEAHALRERLVGELIDNGDLQIPSVIEAMRAVPRHLFAPGLALEEAYANRAMAIGRGQTISQPTIVARMTEALALSGHERVLEVGPGSGYQAAVLSLLAREVLSIERLAALAVSARDRLARLGYANVRVICGDGHAGWPAEAPFDRIVVTAAPAGVPRALLDQLADGGAFVLPVGPPERGAQRLVRIARRGEQLETADLGAVSFVPMRPGVGP